MSGMFLGLLPNTTDLSDLINVGKKTIMEGKPSAYACQPPNLHKKTCLFQVVCNDRFDTQDRHHKANLSGPHALKGDTQKHVGLGRTLRGHFLPKLASHLNRFLVPVYKQQRKWITDQNVSSSSTLGGDIFSRLIRPLSR